MRDFDAEREKVAEDRADDLAFKVGGETFHVRPFIEPEVLVAFDSEGDGMLGVVNGFDRFVKALILPEENDAWDRVRKEAKPPLNLHTIEQIASELMKLGTGRPTSAPSPLPRGRTRSADTSKAA